MINKYRQQGFTLLELMVALVLGLLIVAAGISVFIGGQKSLNLQNGLNELQQNANFGLAVLTHDLRHANLNTPSTQKINNKQVGSGIIFTNANLPSSLSAVDLNLFTKESSDSGATVIASDQLTIQYIPEYRQVTSKQCKAGTAGAGGECTPENQEDVVIYKASTYDCEGRKLEFSEPRVVVQRYHLKQDTKQIPGQPPMYSLYCDAGDYVDGDTEISGMSNTGNGEQLMQRIDAFKIILGVKDKDKKLRYMTIKDYLTSMPITVTDPSNFSNIISVEISVLARSTSQLNSEGLINNAKKYKMAGNEMELNSTQKSGGKYLREVFSQVVAFRNTLGAS